MVYGGGSGLRSWFSEANGFEEAIGDICGWLVTGVGSFKSAGNLGLTVFSDLLKAPFVVEVASITVHPKVSSLLVGFIPVGSGGGGAGAVRCAIDGGSVDTERRKSRRPALLTSNTRRLRGASLDSWALSLGSEPVDECTVLEEVSLS